MEQPLSRTEIDEFWQRWLAGNRTAEEARDWGPLADFFAVEATYGWMYTPDEHFMAVGREQIREWALGTEMAGLEGWHYDYVATVVDERARMIVGFWRQRAGILDDNGEEYEIRGIGGSWFGLQQGPEGIEIAWQRDWFDLGSTAHTFLELAGSGRAPQPLLDRMGLHGPSQPGHYSYADLPSTVWPPPVATQGVEPGEERARAETHTQVGVPAAQVVEPGGEGVPAGQVVEPGGEGVPATQVVEPGEERARAETHTQEASP